MSGEVQWEQQPHETQEFDRKGPISDIAFERHYTIPEISKLWHLDKNTVRRLFAEEPGILCFGSEEKAHRRPYKSFRVPESVMRRVHRKLRQAS